MSRPRTEIWFRAPAIERGGVRYDGRDAFARLLPANGVRLKPVVKYPWLTRAAAEAKSKENNAGALFFDSKEAALLELGRRISSKQKELAQTTEA